MTTQVFKNSEQANLKWIEFSDGAINVNVNFESNLKPTDRINITVLPETPVKDVLWEVTLVTSAIRETHEDAVISLNLPYLPNARADRVFNEGDASPLKTFIEAINHLEFHSVRMTDIHSSFTEHTGFIQNMVVKKQKECFLETYHQGKDIPKNITVVCPDKGAQSKSLEIYQELVNKGFNASFIECSKKRDIKTGQIVEIVVPDIPVAKSAIVVDDICDGGGTFIPIAEKLRRNGAVNIYLYVTHGIFSKGLDLFKGKYDNIRCYQTVGNHVNQLDIVKFNEGE